MLTIVTKFIALPFYPVGFAMVLLAAAVIALLLKRQKTGIVCAAAAGLVLYVFSAGPLPDIMVRSLESRYAPSEHFPQASAIVLLTGGEVVKAPPRLFDEINAAGDRILFAALLAKRKVAPRLIITGGNIDCLRTVRGSQAQAAGRICTGFLGVDSSMILYENNARTTYENALFTRRFMDSLHLPDTVILVTSAIHMPRSVALFKKQGMTVYPAPTDFIADVPPQFKLMGFLPTSGTLENSSNALHEIYGIIAYRILGKL